MLQLVNEICKSFSRVRLYLTKPFGGRYPGLDPENLAKFEWSCDAIYTYPDVVNSNRPNSFQYHGERSDNIIGIIIPARKYTQSLREKFR